MFQSFKSTSMSAKTPEIISSIRLLMKKQNIDWFLVPHADEHQNEYLPERGERLGFLTGFTGSAGFAIIGLDSAYLFVDGRYTVQAANQIDANIFEIKDLISDAPTSFAKTILSKDARVGYDAWLLTISQKIAWQKTAKDTNADLVSTPNLVDEVWQDQPAPPSGKAWLHPEQYAGRSASDKLQDIREALKKDEADYLLQTDPASLAWTFNIRGNDLIHNPLTLGWAIIPKNETIKPTVFVSREKFNSTDLEKLESVVELNDPTQFETRLTQICNQSKIHCDPSLVAAWLGDLIESSKGVIVKKRDPVSILRAVKNEVELEGARNAHIRDGVAMVTFLAWLDAQPAGSVNEIQVAQRLENERKSTAIAMDSELREISFDTISGAGANGAIVHYRVTEESNAILNPDSLYLVDSGGQYLDGTTDITRTVAIGTPPPQAIIDNTLVLKGHIAVALARFPKGTRGVDLDGLARMALWQKGKDFAHGTGHGIGSYLNVHEGPQGISKRAMEPFQPGMIVSNEPGYYKEGDYGIRIENLLVVTEAQDIDGGDRPMLGFETISLCPIDIRLIDKAMLTPAEKNWLTAYHIRVLYTLAPYLKGPSLNWLNKATQPL